MTPIRITIRLSEEFKASMVAEATKLNISLSTYVRRLHGDYVRKEQEREIALRGEL